MSHSSQSDFWETRYRASTTPWDFGGVPADLRSFLKRRPKGGRVLIPGCGSGYEIKAFADAGYEVTALDFAPAAVARAREFAGPAFTGGIIEGDFFKHDFSTESFDVIYERTFLCSLTPDRRSAYRDRTAQLLKRNGNLVGYFFYKSTPPDEGPPFGLVWGEADELFARHFLLTKDDPVNDSLPLFAGRERWQERRRTAFKG